MRVNGGQSEIVPAEEKDTCHREVRRRPSPSVTSVTPLVPASRGATAPTRNGSITLSFENIRPPRVTVGLVSECKHAVDIRYRFQKLVIHRLTKP
eukprot:287932-Pyramimonas_sp.AAC.1